MIRSIVFDIGGVLADFRLMGFLAEKGFDAGMSGRIIRAAVNSSYWGQFERGEISEEETLRGFASNDPGIRDELYRAFSDLRGMLVIRDYAIPLIRRLKDAGYGVYYLSNYSKKAYDECGESLAFMPLMDGGMVSFRVGQTKPSPEMFTMFLREYGLEAGECLFVDDTAENVGVAEALGFAAIRYTSYGELIAAFREYGVEIQ